jgi:bifunctional ADP-heptose synthase (sugar kinase/adenylyltransferase)
LLVDTRTKIIDRERAPQGAAWFSGHFDPLLSEHARLLHDVKSPGRLLIVEITNPARPLLAQRARAELVAGLADVDYVVLGGGVSHDAPDSDVTRRFVEHVRQRSNGAKA